MTDTPRKRIFGLPTMILAGALGGLLAVGAALYTRSASHTNEVALAQSAKGVTTVAAVAHSFQPTRRYVGTVEPWVHANVGPQMVSAYVDTVLVRPGAQVKRGEVIATLDCRNASAMSKAVAAQARALDAMRTASANEASRVASLLDGKYVSENEVDLKKADAASKEAQLAAAQAQMLGTSLQVDDCVLRAPFDGEVATRDADPGAFVRPGSSIAGLVDRRMVRITADVPEHDFDAVAPGTVVRIHLLSTGKELASKITRRAPAADPMTRTVHVEVDFEDATRELPVWTTAELAIDVGAPVPTAAVPVTAATVRNDKATVFVVANGVAQRRAVKLLGEREGVLYLAPDLAAGSPVVTEGRTQLDDGDHVTAKLEPWSVPK